MEISVEIHRVALLFHCFQIELEFRNVGFVEGGKPEYPAKNPRSKRTNNKLNPHMTPGVSAPSLLPYLPILKSIDCRLDFRRSRVQSSFLRSFVRSQEVGVCCRI